MRYLVVGTLPPPRLARSVSLLALVDRLEREGHSVEVLPVGVGNPGIRTGGLRARSGADVLLEILRRARDADALVIQLDPGLAGSNEAGRARRAISLAALAGALTLARWRDVEIHIESFGDLPGGVGGRVAALVWRRASRLVVPTPEQREALHDQGRVPLDRIEVSPAATAGAPPATAGDRPAAGDGATHPTGWPQGADMSRESVLVEVRRRAAAERVLAGHHPSDAVSRLLAEADESAPRSPYGRLEPVVRYVYERPALREPVRRVLRVVRPGGEVKSPAGD